MRFFRIPAFTGIETHRDDADRGSLRVVEGCVPHGPGGLRSGPVWEKIGDVDLFSDSDNSQSHMTGADDGKGNSIVYVSRAGDVHDMAVFNTEHTDLVSLGSTYAVAAPTLYNQEAAITPIGNRLYAMGDGTAEAAYIGKGPPAATAAIFPDEVLYDQEWSRFPSCKFYAQGPKKTIFAAGNPAKPLTVYISEPAGLTNPYRDSPHSTELTNHNAGMLSTVDILSSNASQITALSTRGDQVVVHTDKGCHLLYAPQSDQASTGYRVEQAPATNFSGAVNVQVVAGESGTQPFWLGHDGQIYKDEAASRGAEDFKSFADPKQASAKAKGQWEKELPTDLTGSFATYDPQSGMYWIYVESDEYKEFTNNDAPSAPFFLKALPEAAGSPINLTASPDIQAPINLTALPEIVAAPINLIALPEIVSTPINLIALPEAAESPINLIALPDIEAPINLIALPEIVSAPINLIALPDIEAPINLIALPEIVSAPINLIALPEIVSAPINLIAVPEIVESPINLIAIPNGVSTPINLIALPEAAQPPINLIAEVEAVESPINLVALPETVGSPINLIALPETVLAPINLIAEKTCCALEAEWETLIKYEIFSNNEVSWGTDIRVVKDGTTYYGSVQGEYHFTPVDNGNGCFNTATAFKNNNITDAGSGWRTESSTSNGSGWWGFEDPTPNCSLDEDCNPVYDFSTYTGWGLQDQSSGEILNSTLFIRWGPNIEYTAQTPTNLTATPAAAETPINLTATAPVLAAYRDDTSVYFLSNYYAGTQVGISPNSEMRINAIFGDKLSAITNTTPPATEQERIATGTSSRRMSVFFPDGSVAKLFKAKNDFQSSIDDDKYVFWIPMKYGGLRQTTDLVANANFAGRYDWASSITGTYPSWYLRRNDGSQDHYQWLIADASGNYHCMRFSNIGVNSTSSFSGALLSADINLGSNFWGLTTQTRLTGNGNTVDAVWLTPDPVEAPGISQGTSALLFDDMSGVNTATSGYTQVSGKFYKESIWSELPTA